MSVLIIVRHGQSTWNLENRFTGEVDVDLTPQGREEARTAGEKLKGYLFTQAFTSVLRRAEETLSIILQIIGQPHLTVIRSKDLNERNYGDLQGLNKAETAQKYGDQQVAIWRRSFSVQPPGGESLKDTAARVIPFYEQWIEPLLRSGKDILIVAHGNSLRALMMHLEQLSGDEISKVDLPTGLPRSYLFDEKMKVKKIQYL